MTSQGYIQSQAAHTMFFKHSSNEKIAILIIVFIGDIILTGDDTLEIKRQKGLSQNLEIKDLGNLKYFLGMEFASSKRGIFVSQQRYALNLLKETSWLGCKAAETPIDPNSKLQAAKIEEIFDRSSFQHLVGRLIYLSHTHPEVAFAVSMISQFMHSPGQ